MGFLTLNYTCPIERRCFDRGFCPRVTHLFRKLKHWAGSMFGIRVCSYESRCPLHLHIRSPVSLYCTTLSALIVMSIMLLTRSHVFQCRSNASMISVTRVDALCRRHVASLSAATWGSALSKQTSKHSEQCTRLEGFKRVFLIHYGLRALSSADNVYSASGIEHANISYRGWGACQRKLK